MIFSTKSRFFVFHVLTRSVFHVSMLPRIDYPNKLLLLLSTISCWFSNHTLILFRQWWTPWNYGIPFVVANTSYNQPNPTNSYMTFMCSVDAVPALAVTTVVGSRRPCGPLCSFLTPLFAMLCMYIAVAVMMECHECRQNSHLYTLAKGITVSAWLQKKALRQLTASVVYTPE